MQFSELVDPDRHQRFCKVCKHSQREFIDLDFIDWRSPASIAKRYGIRDRASIYRHAHATGLFVLRRQNLAMALDNIIERSDEVNVTSSAIVRAIRARTRITDDGNWVDPPTRSIVTHLDASSDASTLSNAEGSAPNGYAGPPPTHPPYPTTDYYWQQYLAATKIQTNEEPSH